jgi:lysophospholipase L1-like esterase
MIAATWAETTDKQAAPVRPGLVAIGDSFIGLTYITTPWNGSSLSRTAVYYSGGYLATAMIWTRQPCTFIPKGVSGESAATGLTRFDADVVAKHPHVVLINYGSNDMALSRTAADTFADMRAMYAKAWRIGAKVIATTCPPRNSFTSTQMKEACKLNTLMRNYAATNPQDFYLVDLWRALADPATGNYIAAYTADGIHPNAAGAWRLAKEFDSAFGRFFMNPTTNLARCNINDDNLLVNPMFITSGGSLLTAGITGTVGSGWAAFSDDAATVVANVSLVARADGLGNWQQVNVTSDPTPTKCAHFLQSIATGFAAGDLVQAWVEFETDSAGWTNGSVEMFLMCQDGSGNLLHFTRSLSPDTSVLGVRPESGVQATPPVVVPAGTTQITCRLSKGGTGTVRFGRVSIRKLPTS